MHREQAVDDGWIGFGSGLKAVVAQGDGQVAQVTGGFVADVPKGEGVVDADLAGGLVVEKLFVELALLEVTEAVVVQTEAVDGLHCRFPLADRISG